MADEARECPICKLEEQKIMPTVGKDTYDVYCLRCGHFRLTGTALAAARASIFDIKFSAWIRERHELGDTPLIAQQMLEEIPKNFPNYSVPQKQLLLLNALARKSQYPGHLVMIWGSHDYPLAWAGGQDELRFYMLALNEQNLFLCPTGAAGSDNAYKGQITSKGWELLEKRARTPTLSDQGFVAMSFGENLDTAWETALKPAIDDAGYKPYRVSAEPDTDHIYVKMMAEIRASRFVVADVTDQRQSVYFEAGYAQGLGIQVIWTVREDDFRNIHFDTKQYPYIVWKDPGELKERVYDHVCALFGKREKK